MAAQILTTHDLTELTPSTWMNMPSPNGTPTCGSPSSGSPISSPIERLRFLDAGAVIVVFILASAAAFAFRLPVAGDLEVLLRAVVSLDDEVVVERVWRDGGDRSGVICISCLIAL